MRERRTDGKPLAFITQKDERLREAERLQNRVNAPHVLTWPNRRQVTSTPLVARMDSEPEGDDAA
jgi:hypothetical protein